MLQLTSVFSDSIYDHRHFVLLELNFWITSQYYMHESESATILPFHKKCLMIEFGGGIMLLYLISDNDNK